jgi:biotin carboxylase
LLAPLDARATSRWYTMFAFARVVSERGRAAVVLVVVYDLGSAGPTDVASSARGVCDVVFVVDPVWPHVRQHMPELRSCGTVIEVPDSSAERIAEVVAALDPAGIITFSESRIALTASVAEKCGLRFHDPRLADLLTDKHLQRRILETAGVDMTRSRAVSSEGDIEAALALVGLPAVLKPRRGAGSRDTYKVTSVQAGVALIRAARLDGGLDGGFVVEELLRGDPTAAGPEWGDYVSVESVVRDGDVRHACVTGKFPLVEPFRETGQFVPATLPAPLADAVAALAGAALRALGVRWGVTHTEVKLTPEGPRVIEVNGRVGGYVGDILRRASGYDLLRTAIQIAAGQPVQAPHPEFHRVAFRHYLAAPPHPVMVTAVHGVVELTRIAGVSHVEIRARPGQMLDPRRGTQECFGIVYGESADHTELKHVIAAVGRTFVPEYTVASEAEQATR